VGSVGDSLLLPDYQRVSTPVSAEYRGLARAFINRAKSAHYNHNDFINGLTAEIEQRHERHPERSLPADMLASISRRWRAEGDPYRLSFVSNIKNNKGTICEARIGYHGLIHSSWAETEPNAIVVFAALSVTRSKAQISAKVGHTFSAHSIARFYERSRCREDRDVIRAMVTALAIEPKDHCVGADVSAGSWRGIIKSRRVGEDRMLVWCARTWIE
jgi:hypothetical protein